MDIKRVGKFFIVTKDDTSHETYEEAKAHYRGLAPHAIGLNKNMVRELMKIRTEYNYDNYIDVIKFLLSKS